MKICRVKIAVLPIKSVLLLNLILGNSLLSCREISTPANDQPNLLFIMTDQQRFDALSYAGNTVLKTPNLDRLASEGVWFKNAHTQVAVCGPARATILTGMAAQNHGVISNQEAYETEESGIMPMQTFDEVLAENGYICEYYGKWHAPIYRGRVYNNRPVTAAGIGRTELGEGQKMAYLNYLEPLFPNRELQDGEFYDTFTDYPYIPNPIDRRYDLARRGENTDFRVGQSDIHGVISIPAKHHVSAFETEQTIEAIERLKGVPFSITCSFHHPHPPFTAAQEYIGLFPPDSMPIPYSINDDMSNSPYLRFKNSTDPMYSDPEMIKYFISGYYALVKEIDDRVGEILDKLDELGLTDNTLVIFKSDHGEMLGAHGMRSKNIFYEESSRIPLIMRLPERIQPGTKVDNYISNINLFATILDYLNILPRPNDGFSLKGLIEGTDNINGKYVVTEWLSNLETKPSHMVIKDGWKLMIPHPTSDNVIKALYDLNNDPYEMTNLLGNNPDSRQYEPKVAELMACFQEWQQKVNNQE